MIYNHIGILWSGMIVVCILLLWWKNSRPAFLIPIKRSSEFFLLPLLFRRMVLLAIILLPLQMGFPSSHTVQIKKPLPVQIVRDVSLSMSAYDVAPSRFSVAKNVLLHMSKTLQGYALSLISFSWVPVITFPFTYDTPAFMQAISQTTLGDFPPIEWFLGTAIGDALLLALHNIQAQGQNVGIPYQENTPSWVILLITDGDANEGYDPKEVLPILQSQRIPVYVLGIGTAKYLMGYDRFQQPIMSAINTPLLEMIATQTSGAYQRIESIHDADQFVQSLVQTITSYEETQVTTNYRYLQPYLLRILEIGVGWRLLTKLYFLFQYLKKKEKGI